MLSLFRDRETLLCCCLLVAAVLDDSFLLIIMVRFVCAVCVEERARRAQLLVSRLLHCSLLLRWLVAPTRSACSAMTCDCVRASFSSPLLSLTLFSSRFSLLQSLENIPEFKLILVGDGGVGESKESRRGRAKRDRREKERKKESAQDFLDSLSFVHSSHFFLLTLSLYLFSQAKQPLLSAT